MTRILELDVPAPCKWISSNQRMHRMVQAKLTAIWRNAGTVAAHGYAPFAGPVHITANIWKPRLNRFDPNNLAPTTKAIVDGLITAGLLADDDFTHVIGPDHRYGGKGAPRIVLRIEEVR